MWVLLVPFSFIAPSMDAMMVLIQCAAPPPGFVLRVSVTAIAARTRTTPIAAKVSLKPITSAWCLTALPTAIMACWRAAAGSGAPSASVRPAVRGCRSVYVYELGDEVPKVAFPATGRFWREAAAGQITDVTCRGQAGEGSKARKAKCHMSESCRVRTEMHVPSVLGLWRLKSLSVAFCYSVERKGLTQKARHCCRAFLIVPNGRT